VRKLAIVLAVVAPGIAAAQVSPGAHYFEPHAGTLLAGTELLRNTATYPTFRVTDPYNPVVTDIKLDPGVLLGFRYGYGLTRRLLVEAEFNWAVSVHAIRQLEIKPDTDPDAQPQYETTTTDAHILMYFLNLSYFPPVWPRVNPFLTFGVGNHTIDLVKKGSVDADPIYDRAFVFGLGSLLRASDRLGIRVEVRDFMYNFRYDNQYVDPVESRQIIDPVLRPDFYNTTSASGTKFQNELVLTIGFMIRPF